MYVKRMESGLCWLGSQFLHTKTTINSMEKSSSPLKILFANIGLPMVGTIIQDTITRYCLCMLWIVCKCLLYEISLFTGGTIFFFPEEC